MDFPQSPFLISFPNFHKVTVKSSLYCCRDALCFQCVLEFGLSSLFLWWCCLRDVRQRGRICWRRRKVVLFSTCLLNRTATSVLPLKQMAGTLRSPNHPAKQGRLSWQRTQTCQAGGRAGPDLSGRNYDVPPRSDVHIYPTERQKKWILK